MNTQQWLQHFQANKSQTLATEGESYQLSPEERERISKSIQLFQLGESSEGRCLIAQAKAFAQKFKRAEYMETIRYLIREENRHSAYLNAFMKIHQIPQIKRGWTDSCFRFLRRLAGIELSVRVLVTAEVIAMTYYECLGKATNSPLLKRICNRMCAEEKAHVEFQMHHIHEMNFTKHALASSLTNILHFGLLIGTVVAVWFDHHRVLKVQYDMGSFVAKVWTDFQEHTYRGQLSAAQSLVKAGYISEEALCEEALCIEG